MAIATRRLQPSAAAPLVAGDGPPGSREAQRRVMEAAVEAGDLAATIGAIAGLTRSAAVLQDPFLAVLASAPAPGAPTGGSPAAGDPVGPADVALARSGCPLVRDLLRTDPGGNPAAAGDRGG